MSGVKVERVNGIIETQNKTQYLLKVKDLWLVSECTTECSVNVYRSSPPNNKILSCEHQNLNDDFMGKKQTI